MRKSDKPLIVDQLAIALQEAKSVTVFNYQGMASKQLSELRSKVKAAGGKFLVAKNTLLKLAFLKTVDKKQIAGYEKHLEGPTAVIFATDDEVAPLQALGKAIQETELPKLKFGIFSGIILETDKLLALSKLPGKNIIRSQLLNTLLAPQYNIVSVLNGNLQRLVYILSERQKAISQIAHSV